MTRSSTHCDESPLIDLDSPTRRLRLGLLTLFVFSALAAACAPVQVTMRESLDRREYQDAIDRGRRWLKNHKSQDEQDIRTSVEKLIAEAIYGKVRQAHDIEVYQKYRYTYQDRVYHQPWILEAYQMEAKLWFETRVTQGETVALHREFRAKYPRSSYVDASKRREVSLAYMATVATRSIQEHVAFRETYGDWLEAERWIEKSRKAEVSIATSRMKRARVPEIQAFIRRYGSWTEARASVEEARKLEVHAAFRAMGSMPSVAALRRFRDTYKERSGVQDVLARALEAEITSAYERARDVGTPESWREFRIHYAGVREALDRVEVAGLKESKTAFERAVRVGTAAAIATFRRAYPNAREAPEAHQREAQLRMKALVADLKAGGRDYDALVRDALAVLDSYEDREAIIAPHERVIWKQIKRIDVVAAYRSFRRLYPTSKHVAQALTSEQKLAADAAFAKGTPAALQAFIRGYPEASRAFEAERLFRRLVRLERDTWPKATITYERQLPNGEVEIYVDVRDCDDERVSGLTRDVFSVFAGTDELEVVDFKGLEESRPVDIVFALDLSGSMDTEREAVISAIDHFVTTLAFRERSARVGLVLFSDQVLSTTAPERSLTTFRSNLQQLPPNIGGGDGEDSLHAMYKAAEYLKKSAGERIFIEMSDEPLQINIGGRLALGKRGRGECRVVFERANCVRRCKTYACQRSCAARLAPAGGAMTSTVKDFKVRKRVAAMSQSEFTAAYTRCGGGSGENVQAGSPWIDKIARVFQQRSIRSYFLVPSNQGGFDPLAQAIDGRVVHVPQDARDSEPYVEALNEIVDQLSRQYVFRVRPKKGAPKTVAVAPGTPKRVLVRNMHIWNGLQSTPPKGVVALLGTDARDGCPSFVAVTDVRGIFESSACGTQWKRSLTYGRGVRVDQVIRGPDEDALMLLDDKGQLSLVHRDRSGSLVLEEVATPEGKIANALVLDGDLWAILEGPDRAHRVIRNSFPWAELDDWEVVRDLGRPARSGALPLLLNSPRANVDGTPAEDADICLIDTRMERHCVRSDGAWTTAPVTGLTRDALRRGASTLGVPGEYLVTLLRQRDGAIYRSLNGGRSWELATGGKASVGQLAIIPGERPAVCRTTSRGVECSEDQGLNWWRVGRSHLSGDRMVLTSLEGSIYAADDSDVHRLHEMVNRELPAAMVFFDTSKAVPRREMYPFLDATVERLEADPDLHLRIEGHTDARGGTDYNRKLATARAKAVAAYMEEQGLTRDRLLTLSYGELRPIVKGVDSASLARNRRVELILVRRPSSRPSTVWWTSKCER